MSTPEHEFAVYSIGLCYASVCTSLDDEQTGARLNAAHPTGVGPWKTSPDPTFNRGGPNPRPCDVWPDTHRHMLFEC